MVGHLLLALTQEQDLIEQPGGQRRLVIGTLTEDVSVHLHAANQEVDIARPNSQALGLDALAADGLHCRGQLELLLRQLLCVKTRGSSVSSAEMGAVASMGSMS